MSPRSRHRPQSVLGFTTSVPRSRARQYTVPAGRGCFPCIRLGSYHQPAATDRRWARRQKTPRSPSRTPSQLGLEAVAAVLHGQAGPARVLLDIYLSHNVNGTRSYCSHYIRSLMLSSIPLLSLFFPSKYEFSILFYLIKA